MISITFLGIGFSFICAVILLCLQVALIFAFSFPCLDFSKIQVFCFSVNERSGEICQFEPNRGLLHTFLLFCFDVLEY